ncbi:MAG: helicase [Micrococcales bacterium 73-13]|nr:MAG: helicase [Micrococcales bacterium 73-13]
MPSGERARLLANLAAIRTLRALDAEDRTATPDEQQVLAAWSSWGAIPAVFDDRDPEWADERAVLRELLSETGYAQARRTVLNAHYTDPAYVSVIWHALAELGFEGGRVLEPGCGSGTFLGLAPETAQVVGVELDATSARIARALYPQHEVRAESFAETKYPGGWFDAAVGNVPFGDVSLHDPIDNPHGHSIHNHFLLKAVRLTRPGGIVATLTSHYTLDAANPAVRRELSRSADLVGAIRLPTGAHRRTAGTEALTDLLILRPREEGRPVHDATWESVVPRVMDGEGVKLNAYLDQHPENVLGTLHVGQGMYNAQTLQVRADDLGDTPGRLRAALTRIATEAEPARLRLTARTPEQAAAEQEQDAIDAAWDGTISASADGGFTTVTAGKREALRVGVAAGRELRALLRLRDLAARQLDLERATLDETVEISTGRASLLAEWQSYVRRYGPINRYTPTPTGRTTDDGEPIMARRTPPATRLLRGDPFGPLVFALEVFDDDTQEAEPAALLTRRVIAPRPERLGADTPADALQICLDRHGRIDLTTIADLLGETPEQTRMLLGELVYDDPEHDGELVHGPAYLSGSIYPKLEAARAAAERDERYGVNVAALEGVLPDPLGPEEIVAKIGAVWISPDYHQQFLRELLGDTGVTVTCPLPATWKVRGGQRFTVRASQEWGTERRPAPDLFELIANQTPIRVDDTYKDPDGRMRSVFNPTETAAAQDKASLIQEQFEEWVWADPDRAKDLAAEYNRRFNSITLRDYTADGEYLSLPGMTEAFVLRPHQRAAVARMIAEPAVGLFHEVGAGKTAEMVVGAMELRRLGMARKPAIVVPNHMLEQFAREWLQLYPQAKILAANSDTLAGDQRRIFVARAAANDWDGIIFTRTAFQRLDLDPEHLTAFTDAHLKVLKQALDFTAADDHRTLKQIEKTIAREEEKVKKLLDTPRDPGVTFEATGIDYAIVDEAHDYKNLVTTSNIPDAAIEGSARAFDMALKIDYLRRANPSRYATFATATPIANSVTEAHVMQRYLRPDLLEEAGVLPFDAWAATFGQTVTEVEMAPAGGGSFRVKTRFAKFQNVPEMLRLWRVFGDVKTADDLDLPTPLLKARPDGRRIPETVVLIPGEEVREYVVRLGERAERVANRAVDPSEDNMLNISTDGRKAALDIRMVDPSANPAIVPLDEIADRIARIHHAHSDRSYFESVGGQTPSPLPGAFQLVFCDLGTPKPDKWNAYHYLQQQLVERGVPEGGIRFVHEARNDAEKGRLFAACRDGKVAVLIASTSKAGVGTNVQNRAVALHDVDCPWKPAEVAQRHGRILRQGNQNEEVEIIQYVTEHTFAAYMWQAIERKSKFINQVMRGRLDVREIDDLGSDSISAAEAKALASGNPLLLERSIALNEATRLERLERAWHRAQSTLRATIESADRTLDRLRGDQAALEAAVDKVEDLSGDRFRITIGTAHYTSRTDAAAAISQWARSRSLQYARPMRDDRSHGTLGQISGFPIVARTRTDLGQILLDLNLEGVPGSIATSPMDKVLDEPIGLIRQLEHRAANIPDLIARTAARITETSQSRADAERNLGAPFKHRAALEAARAELARVEAELAALAKDDAPAPAGVTTETPTAARPAPVPDPYAPVMPDPGVGPSLS